MVYGTAYLGRLWELHDLGLIPYLHFRAARLGRFQVVGHVAQ